MGNYIDEFIKHVRQYGWYNSNDGIIRPSCLFGISNAGWRLESNVLVVHFSCSNWINPWIFEVQYKPI